MKNFGDSLSEHTKNIYFERKKMLPLTKENLLIVDIASSLSNLVDTITEGIHKIRCKDCDSFLEYENMKDDLIKYKCLSCNKDYSNKLDEFFF